MCEGEEGQLVVLLFDLLMLVFNRLLLTQHFISLDEINLFLSFVIADLLLVQLHFLSQNLQELLVLLLFRVLDMIFALLLLIDLGDNML